MPTFEVDVRGEGASGACDRLAAEGIETERLPHGIVIGWFDAGSLEEAERRVHSIIDSDDVRVSVRSTETNADPADRPTGGPGAAGRGEAGGADPAADPFDQEVHPAQPHVEDRP